MTLQQMQDRVKEWIGQWKDGAWTPHENLARLTEEVGELAREINQSYGPKKKKPSEPDGSIEAELGDILFVLCAIANSTDVSLTHAFESTIQKYDRRDKDRFERA